jgi:DNA-binding NarL/FixJ family response regulator
LGHINHPYWQAALRRSLSEAIMNEEAGGDGGGPYKELSLSIASKLTGREQEVLSCYLATLNDKKVARHLGTHVQTVRSYCQKLLMAEFQAAAVWGFNPSMN